MFHVRNVILKANLFHIKKCDFDSKTSLRKTCVISKSKL